MTTLEVTKRVRYEANERLDLNDKLAELELFDHTLQQYRKIGVDSADGRIFLGFTKDTVTGPNTGFALKATVSLGVDRAGNVLILDGSTSLSITLATNAINYIYAYFTETSSDSDTRRFYAGGTETSNTINTRVTRAVAIHRTNTAYGTGIPSFSDFAKTANIGGIDRELIPLFAVVVDVGDTVTRIDDYRPVFAPANAGAGTSYYDVSGVPDFPFNFAPTDVATLGITDVRKGLVALADRIKGIKGTTTWYEDGIKGLNIGFSGTVVEDTVQVGDANFGLFYNAGNPQLIVESGKYLQWARATDTWSLTGTFGPAADGGSDLGSSSMKWGNLYMLYKATLVDTAFTSTMISRKLDVQADISSQTAGLGVATFGATGKSISVASNLWTLYARTQHEETSGTRSWSACQYAEWVSTASSILNISTVDCYGGVIHHNSTAGASFGITTAAVFRAYNGTRGTTNKWTSQVGLYVENMTAADNNYGVYIVGASSFSLYVEAGDVKLAGRTALGAAAPSNVALLAGSCNSSTYGYGAWLYNTVDTNEADITGGVWSYLDVNCTTGQTATDLRGIYSQLDKDGAGAISVHYGYRAHGDIDGGTIGSLHGYHSSANVGFTSACTVTNTYHFRATNCPVVSGSITNQYGLYVDNLTSAGNNYGVRVVGASPGFAFYADAGLTALGGDLRLFGSNATISLKAGITGTTGKLRFTFNTDSTDFGSLSLPYDSRTTVGMYLSSSSFPITYGATEHKWNLGVVQYMFMNTSGYVGIGTGHTGADSPLHLYTGDSTVATPIAGTVGTIETAGNAYLSFLTPLTGISGLICGRPGMSDAGRWVYTHTDTLPGWKMNVNGLVTMKVDSGRRVWIGYGEDWTTRFDGSVTTNAQLLNVAGDASASGNAGIGLWTGATDWRIENVASTGVLKFSTVVAGDIVKFGGGAAIFTATGTGSGLTPTGAATFVLDGAPYMQALSTGDFVISVRNTISQTPTSSYAVIGFEGRQSTTNYSIRLDLWDNNASAIQNGLILTNLDNSSYTTPPAYGRVLLNVLRANNLSIHTYNALTRTGAVLELANDATWTDLEIRVGAALRATFDSNGLDVVAGVVANYYTIENRTSAPNNTLGTLWLQDNRPYINTTGTSTGHHAIAHNIVAFSANVQLDATSTFSETAALVTIPANTANVGQAFRVTICGYFANVSSPDAPLIQLRYKDGVSASVLVVGASLSSLANNQPFMFQLNTQIRTSNAAYMSATCRHYQYTPNNNVLDETGTLTVPIFTLTSDGAFVVGADSGSSGTFSAFITNVVLEMM